MIDDASVSAAAYRAPLVMRFGAFGDMVLLTILLRHLFESFGKRFCLGNQRKEIGIAAPARNHVPVQVIRDPRARHRALIQT